MIVAELARVGKRYGDVVALDDITLGLEADSTVALLGPNGSGKTTLASILLGLRRPDTGTVAVAGDDPRRNRTRAAVGATLQEVAFPQTLRVREVVDLVARHFHDRRSADDVLEQFGLLAEARRQTGALSIGQRRRLGVALAFVARRALVILDEPTAGLDREGRKAVWAAVATARAAGAAVLVATHDLDEAEAVASRVVAIDRGRVVLDGSPAAVRGRAGLTRIAYRAAAPPPGFPDAARVDGRIALDVPDAGRAVAALVAAGVALDDLEVRPLTLAEALAALETSRG